MKLQATSYKLKPTQGFTLIEIMVAVSLFAIVAVITTGALVTASNVNRKAQAIKVAIDNLNFAIDSMTLNLQSGKQFHCITNADSINDSASAWLTIYDDPAACSVDIGQAIAFNFGPCPSNVCDKVIYRYHTVGNNKSIQVWSKRNGVPASSFVDITAPEVIINSFRVEVSLELNRVLLVIRGNVNDNTNTEFNLQTTIYGR